MVKQLAVVITKLIVIMKINRGGHTWRLQEIDLVEDYKYGNAYPPVFDPSDSKAGTLKIEFHNDEGSKTIHYVTRDGGSTWNTVE
ncbi:hypothetical protein [Paenibacillus sp. OV219]|uniref:hypothetical protein n=1 Tax=Paenibacillus sp. OV219 TaxID=1884377 RepID=UPI0008CE9A64|nr:hypothetical protein [Paenibacillus sp. OV219]SEP16484.1 hypothetical protein SAMN05518847_1232 [Paenibacillus sp. OV219]